MLTAARWTLMLVPSACLLPAQSAQPPVIFHAGTRLVEVDVVVRDSHGYVTGLAKDDFTLWDCKAGQRSPYMIRPTGWLRARTNGRRSICFAR